MSSETQVKLPAAGDRIPVDYDRAPTYERMIAQKDVAVPMRDGVNLSVDIYRPDATEKFPALLAFSIYNKDLQGPEVAAALPPQPAWSSLWAGLLGSRRHQVFRLARLCPCHRFAARYRQIRRRRKPRSGTATI